MFKIGDIVEITAEMDATGMLDFTKDWSYRVHECRVSELTGHSQVFVLNDSGRTDWYHQNHFKLKEEKNMECLFKEGQTVYCLMNGKGVVRSVDNDSDYPVSVVFDGDTEDYTSDGKFYAGGENRFLFFSPPVVTGATEPVFEPVLKKGDSVVLSDTFTKAIVNVVNETATEIFYEADGVVTFVDKSTVEVHRLGEKIKFN